MKKRLALAIVAIACLFGTACFAKDTYQFEVLSTTDMHGRATDYNVATQKEDLNSMVRVASVVERERKVFGDNLILIDNGDLLQGTLLSQYAITQKPKEENPMITAVKQMKYKVWVMGNHEFNYSPKVRDAQIAYARQGGIDILGANIVLKEDGLNMRGVKAKKGAPYYDPYTLQTINFGNGKQVRVAIIGLGNANNANWDRACNYPNMQFSSLDNPEGLLEFEIDKWVDKIKKADLADIIIVSAHSGKSTDDGVQSTTFMKESQAVSGAQKSKGIALLIYGHDHSANIEKVTNAEGKEIYIVNGGGTTVTKNVFTVDFDQNNKIKDYTVSAEAIPLKDEKPNKQLSKKINHWYKDAVAWSSKPLGKFSGGWDKITSETEGKTNVDLVVKQTELNNLIHKVQLWASWMDYKTHGIKGATVSITSSVVSSKDDKTLAFIPHDGDTVSINELALIYRFSNNILCTVDMTPQQLYAWMSRVADKLMIDENGNAKIKPDQSIHGTDTFYGIDYTFDLTKPEGQRVVSAKIKGQNLLEMKEPVRVVLNTFRMAGAHSFYETTKLTEKDCAWNATDFHPEDEANVQSQLGEYVKHLKNVTPDQPTEYGYDSKWEVLTK